MAHLVNHFTESFGVSRHFEPNVKSLSHPQGLLNVSNAFGANVNDTCRPHFFRKLQTPGIHVRDDDVSGTGMFYNRRGHATDWTGAGDQDVFPEDWKRQSGMNSVSERIEDRRHVAVDRCIMMPDIGHGQRQILGERTWPVHSDPFCVSTQVSATGQTVTASPADHMSFAANDFAWSEIRHV
jgi:hypothetical protein